LAAGGRDADGKAVPMYQEVPGEDRRTLVYRQADARAWARPEDGEVVIFPRFNWWNNIVRIQTYQDELRVTWPIVEAAGARERK
jgi:hypothetical protein